MPKMCPNCGKNPPEPGRVVCAACRGSFPGDPRWLEELEHVFAAFEQDELEELSGRVILDAHIQAAAEADACGDAEADELAAEAEQQDWVTRHAQE